MKKVLGLCLILMIGGEGLVTGADFDGDSRDDIAIFRPATGLWAIKNITWIYFGGASDEPVAGDYNGNGLADIGIYRPSSGLWAIKDVTREYFGSSASPIVGGGSGPRTFDYVVKPEDGNDLVAALQATHQSVFIPAGTYNVSQVITVPAGLRLIQGEVIGTMIQFAGDGQYLSIDSPYCVIDRLTVDGGGDTGADRGNLYINAPWVTVRDCWSQNSLHHGFDVAVGANNASFINCVSEGASATGSGFNNHTTVTKTRVTNCMVQGTANGPVYGFNGLTNLSSCYVAGDNQNVYAGFRDCEDVVASRAVACYMDHFVGCKRLSGCSVDGHGTSIYYGFRNCGNLSSCHVENLPGIEYSGCWKMDTDSCD